MPTKEHNTTCISQRISFEKEIPPEESQGGEMSQTPSVLNRRGGYSLLAL